MSKSGKIVKYLAAIIGTVIIIAIIFSKVIFSSDRLTALVLPKISQLLNRDVSAQQVELSFFPTIGIKITGLRVDNPSAGKFDTPFLLNAGSVVIDAKILPLLKNRLVINNVIFYSPTLYLEENLKGKLNTYHLLSESLYRNERNVRGSLSSLLLSNFEVANGTVIWNDDRAGIALKFLRVDFRSRIKTVVEEDRLLLSSKLRVGGFQLWKGGSDLFQGDNIDVSANLDYDKRHDRLQIRSDQASIFGVHLKTSIDFSFYPTTSVSVYTSNVDSSAASVYNLLPAFLQKVVLKNSIKGRLGIGFHLARRRSAMQMRLNLSLIDFDARLRSGDSLTISKFNGEYNLRGDSSSISLSMPEAKVGKNFASVSFTLNPPTKVSADVVADMDLKKLAHNFGIPDVDKFSGTVRARYFFDYNSRLKKVNAGGRVAFDNALVEIPIGIDTLYTGRCDGSIFLTNNRATFNNFEVRLGRSDFTLSGVLKDYQSAFVGSRTLMPSLKMRVVSRVFSTIGLLPHLNLNIGRPLLAWLPTASVSLNFSAGKFYMPADSLAKVTANLHLLDYFVRLRRLSYSSSIGNFTVTGWTDYSQEGKTTFSIRTSVTTPDFGNLLRRYLGHTVISGGSGRGSITLNGVYNDSGKVDLASLGGRGHFDVSDVSIRHYRVLTKLYSFLGADGKDSARFKDAAFTIDITDGRVYFNRLVAYGTPFDFKLDGWHGFDGTLDYKLALKVYPPLSVRMSRYLTKSYPNLSVAPDNTLTLGVVAGGTTNDARFTIVSFNGAIAQAGSASSNSLLAAK